jgi:HEAT repeat protein
MWWWNLTLPAVLGSAYLGKILTARHQRLRIWQQSAQALRGVSEIERSHLLVLGRAKITARSGPLTIRITGVTGSEDQVAVVIEGLAGFPGVKLRRKLFNLWAREIETGDETFDDVFLVEGPLRPACALLDETTRHQLVRATADRDSLEIRDGRLRAEVSEKELSRILPLLLKISQRFTDEPVDVDRQIARNARQDPEPGVRIFNLLLLAREYPDDPATLAVLRDACSDGSPEVRLRAALELGEDGRDILLKLAENPEDDASSARAISYLAGELTVERTKSILSNALHKDLSQAACACLEVLGRRRAAAVDVLAQVMAEEKGKLAAAAAVALGTTGEAAAEPPLLQALQSEDSDLREAAATALGKVGSVAAVQPLKEATERFWLDLDLRQAARQAIAGIQARLEGASPGQLSLAATEAGQLSLAQDEIGLLAFPTEEQEQPPHRARETPGVRPV